MSVVYSAACINLRMAAVQAQIDGGGANANLRLLAGGTVISTIALARPSGTVAGGVLTFSGVPLVDPSAAGTGVVTAARVEDSTGTIVISGLSVGIPQSGADLVIANGVNSTLVTAGQTVALLSATIQGN